jgi:hypothetical protein
MGLVLEAPRFTAEDVAAFAARMRPEQTSLEEWSAAGRVACGPRQGGFEVDAWLVGPDLRPTLLVGPQLRDLDDPAVVLELATFNCVIHGPVANSALTGLAEALEAGGWAPLASACDSS